MLGLATAVSGQHSPRKRLVKKKHAVMSARTSFDPKRDPSADLVKATELASKRGLRIILDVGGEWCSWCVHMDKFFSRNPKLLRLRMAGFVWMKVNCSEENENSAFLSAYPEIPGYPHLFVIDATGKLLHSQDTSEFERGETYDLKIFTKFLKDWMPKRGAK